jgi:hypothetical protein
MHTIEMEEGDSVTFREWAVDGKFNYPFDFTTHHYVAVHSPMQCVSFAGAFHRDDVYQQFTLVASTPGCTWEFKIRSADEKDTLHIKFVVTGEPEP